MAKKTSNLKTINTPDGTTLHLYECGSGVYKPHSFTGPAITSKTSTEYYIHGIKYEYDRWLELSSSYRRRKIVEDLIIP